MANTLGDLTRRECRFAHPNPQVAIDFPFDARRWGQLGLPTLRECSSGWILATPPFAAAAFAVKMTVDFWANKTSKISGDPFPWADDVLATAPGNNVRMADDVILTNVIGFDVKAWDPTAGGTGAYVDLGYDPGQTTYFSGLGENLSRLMATPGSPRVYDTYSTSYEGPNASNGFDDPDVVLGVTNGIVDDDSEKASVPPYPVPLRGIQVKIRVFEPDSRQIREVTVIQDFLTQ